MRLHIFLIFTAYHELSPAASGAGKPRRGGAVRKDRILIVDDEKDIVSFVRAYLEREGYPTLVAYDGETALRLWREHRPDLVVLDILMPMLDGYAFCREVRKLSRVPIIILSARAEEEDRVRGLELGADDYVIKPFSPRELVARIRAVLRRSRAEREALLCVGPLVIDRRNHLVTACEREVVLTPTEFAILAALAAAPGNVLSREKILHEVQGDLYGGYDRNVDTHVKNIRRKLKDAAGEWGFIETVYGVGYRLQARRKA
ncbi:MAG: response regulator transcription factor [Actinobacteria bacterium]|nr:response regulator transcription factor [Actinomycetota bacterium]